MQSHATVKQIFLFPMATMPNRNLKGAEWIYTDPHCSQNKNILIWPLNVFLKICSNQPWVTMNRVYFLNSDFFLNRCQTQVNMWLHAVTSSSARFKSACGVTQVLWMKLAKLYSTGTALDLATIMGLTLNTRWQKTDLLNISHNCPVNQVLPLDHRISTSTTN